MHYSMLLSLFIKIWIIRIKFFLNFNFQDIKKDFDSINHSLLLKKLYWAAI